MSLPRRRCAVLISGLTASFLAGVQDNDAIPQDLS